MAIGISILWPSIGMINMAHGATLATSGYAAWLASSTAKPVILVAFDKTLTAKLALAGATVGAGVTAGALVGAINLATVQLLLWNFGPRQRGLPKLFGFGKFDLWGVPIRYDQAGTIISTAVILGIVLAWLKISR